MLLTGREYKESLHFGRSRVGFRDKAAIFPSGRKDIFSLRGHPSPLGVEIRIHRFDLLIFGDNKSLRRSFLEIQRPLFLVRATGLEPARDSPCAPKSAYHDGLR